jgi:hypothetical protein
VTKRRVKKTPFKVGERVVRNKAVGGSGAQRGDLGGTIVKVTAVRLGAGGTRARVRVRWDNGHEGSVEDRQIVLAPQPSEIETKPKMKKKSPRQLDREIGEVLSSSKSLKAK